MRLLDKNESTRLGSKSGASEVKQHKWFSKINWGLLRNTQPPVSFVIHFTHPCPHSLGVTTRCGLGLGLAITLLAVIKHVVFDARSSVRHKGAQGDGVMVFDNQVC